MEKSEIERSMAILSECDVTVDDKVLSPSGTDAFLYDILRPFMDNSSEFYVNIRAEVSLEDGNFISMEIPLFNAESYGISYDEIFENHVFDVAIKFITSEMIDNIELINGFNQSLFGGFIIDGERKSVKESDYTFDHICINTSSDVRKMFVGEDGQILIEVEDKAGDKLFDVYINMDDKFIKGLFY